MKLLKYFVLSALFATAAAPKAHAYLTIAESAEVLPMGQYQVGIEPQILLNKGGGSNVSVFLDTAFSESSSGRLTLGGGAVDFNANASFKWVPFPDFANQPAMGLRFSGGLTRDEDENVLQLQVAPLISKKFDTEYGLTVPYVALPFTYLNFKNENVMASHLAMGTEFHYVDWKDVTLGAELGVELNKTYSYISVFATFPFDGEKGFGR
ncbi:hypothetical protein BDW_06180 [Bdellovibrio bacteriovorus W]|nr:hypothetical protein BDW_06180 [Bdellovibrio bacteriovorus W]